MNRKCQKRQKMAANDCLGMKFNLEKQKRAKTHQNQKSIWMAQDGERKVTCWTDGGSFELDRVMGHQGA